MNGMNGPMQGLMNAVPQPGMEEDPMGGGGSDEAVQLLTQLVQRLGSEPITPDSQGQLVQELTAVLAMLTGGV